MIACLCRPIVPRRKRSSLGVSANSQQQCEKHYGGQRAQQVRNFSLEIHLGSLVKRFAGDLIQMTGPNTIGFWYSLWSECGSFGQTFPHKFYQREDFCAQVEVGPMKIRLFGILRWLDRIGLSTDLAGSRPAKRGASIGPDPRWSCVPNRQSSIHRYHRAGQIRGRGQAEAKSDICDFLRVAVASDRGAPLRENSLVLLGYWRRSDPSVLGLGKCS